MSRHEHLRATWAAGQIWETRNDGCETWVPVGDRGRTQPLWDDHQEYRRRPDLEQPAAPKRACRFMLDLQADTRKELADALYNMAIQIERGEMTNGVSGGYPSGFIYELVENDRPTHDEFVRDLRAYLEAKQAAAGAKEVDRG